MSEEADAEPKIRVIAQLAMTGQMLAEVRLHATDTLVDLRRAISETAGETKPIRLVLEGCKLKGIGSLAEAGIVDGTVVNVFRGGLPGWTRICHGDANAQETIGAPLVWDLPIEQVKALALRASRVRIQQRGDPEIAVESKAGSYPIEDLRRGHPLGFKRYLFTHQVGEHWEVPEGGDPDLVPAKLWHTSYHWHRRDHDKLEVKVYHACDNGGGIHWDAGQCGWTCGDSTDLELYIDAE
mmetsp:Transcript_37690/g.104950  ORF Transcript_37690/g.104950 Transcript_37690/m.104950 type:complete len:239 (-) Transcript_37690:55-771(-)